MLEFTFLAVLGFRVSVRNFRVPGLDPWVQTLKPKADTLSEVLSGSREVAAAIPEERFNSQAL